MNPAAHRFEITGPLERIDEGTSGLVDVERVDERHMVSDVLCDTRATREHDVGVWGRADSLRVRRG